ncbi:MAG: cysteine desulfurase family protein [Trueperaceae bacterium]
MALFAPSARTFDLDLDRAATTPLHPEVFEAMAPWFGVAGANPSSLHGGGRAARKAVEDARERVAAAVGVAPGEVVFTSGATEADQLGVLGVLAARRGGHVVASRAEHAAVLRAVEHAGAHGHPVSWVDPEKDGRLDPERVAAAMRPDTALVATMLVNNETGARTDVRAIADVAHAHGAWLLCDAVQALGYEGVDRHALGADLLAVSAHKIEGPVGVGALVVDPRVPLVAQALGGAQERGRRAGTTPTALVVGFGAAAARAADDPVGRGARVAAVRDRFEAEVLRLPGVHRSIPVAGRGPKHAHLRVDGLGREGAETLLVNLDGDGVWASAGSACAAGSLEPSHVLLAMGWGREEARGALRFAFGDDHERADAEEAAARFARALQRTRA